MASAASSRGSEGRGVDLFTLDTEMIALCSQFYALTHITFLESTTIHTTPRSVLHWRFVHICLNAQEYQPGSILRAVRIKPTLWCSKGGHNGFNQTQHIESAATHISQEEHDADAATKLWTQRSADHVWATLRKGCRVHWAQRGHFYTGSVPS